MVASRPPLGQQIHLTLVRDGPDAAIALARDAGQPDLFDRVSAVAGETPTPNFLHSALCAMSLPVRRPADEHAPIIRRDGQKSCEHNCAAGCRETFYRVFHWSWLALLCLTWRWTTKSPIGAFGPSGNRPRYTPRPIALPSTKRSQSRPRRRKARNSQSWNAAPTTTWNRNFLPARPPRFRLRCHFDQ
jgi:hypothetical protein